MHLSQHCVRFSLGKKTTALDRRQLRRITENQHRHAEGEQITPEFGVDHRTFVDDDQLCF